MLLRSAVGQDLELDSLSQIVFDEFIEQTSSPKKATGYFIEHRNAFRFDDLLFKKSIEYLLDTEQHDLAREILKVNPFLMSQHNSLALYHYYRAVSWMLDEEGWQSFKLAEKSLNNASMWLGRSMAPDFGFYSDVENARGYLSVVARGLSLDSLKNEICIVRWEYIYKAIEHYREALIYNPENEIAQKNLDTLLVMLEEAQIDIPPHQYEQNFLPLNGISIDSIDADSMNDVSLIPVLNYSLLPRNHQMILRELHAYDEIILLVDLSGSMDDPVQWSAEASKFVIAHQLAIYIAMNLRANVFLGVITVGRNCDNRSMALNYPIGSVSRAELISQVSSVSPLGHTPLNKRLRMTKDMFSNKSNNKLVFLLSDGMDTCGEIMDLCGTAAMLHSHGIDLSIFSFILETLDPESRSAFSIYQCMVRPSEGKIYSLDQDGGVDDDVDYSPVSNNILELPPMDTSILWHNNPVLFQFPINNIHPTAQEIIRFEKN